MCSSKIADFIIFDQFVFCLDPGHFVDLPRLQFEPQNFNRVSNYSWICQLSHEILLVGLLIYSQSKYIYFQTSGPSLPIALTYHSMVRLGKGQAILGGQSINNVYQAKIYSLTCSNRNCIISLLDRELSVPKGYHVAIPIPDTISGCITGGKKIFQKNSKRSIQANICLTPQI